MHLKSWTMHNKKFHFQIILLTRDMADENTDEGDNEIYDAKVDLQKENDAVR